MADTLPLNFPLPAENISANFNFQDIASGSGYSEFDGFSTRNNTTNSFYLTSNAIFSSLELSTISPAGDGSEEIVEFTTTPLNVPRVIKGLAIFVLTFSVGKGSTGGGGTTHTGYVTVELKKVSSAGAETVLGSSTRTRALTVDGNNALTTARTEVLSIDISSEELIKIGESIRVTLTGTITTTSAGANTTINVAHNPSNNDVSPFTVGSDYVSIGTGGGIVRTTRFISQIPFKINS